MNAGRYAKRLRRGIRTAGGAQLYVRRRTTKRGSDRVLVPLPGAVRYALCVWASYHVTPRDRSVSQELLKLAWDGLRVRLGEDAETILEQRYYDYVKGCEERGEINIFEPVSRDA